MSKFAMGLILSLLTSIFTSCFTVEEVHVSKIYDRQFDLRTDPASMFQVPTTVYVQQDSTVKNLDSLVISNAIITKKFCITKHHRTGDIHTYHSPRYKFHFTKTDMIIKNSNDDPVFIFN